MDHELLHPKGMDEVGRKVSLGVIEPELKREVESKGILKELKSDVMRGDKAYGIISADYAPGKMEKPVIRLDRLDKDFHSGDKPPFHKHRQK